MSEWLIGGGITGDLIRERDWSGTALGDRTGWSPELRTAVSMVINSPVAQVLMWGPEHIMLYNDGYIAIAQDRHPEALGGTVPGIWPEIWFWNSKILEEGFSGHVTSHQEQSLMIARGGVPTEVVFDLFYVPVHVGGKVEGVLCTAIDITQQVEVRRARDLAHDRLQMALSAGNSIGAWDWDVLGDRLIADSRFALIYGVDPERAQAGAPIADYLAGIHPEDVPGVRSAIEKAMATGDVFSQEYRLLGEHGAVRWVSAQGRCILDENGRCIRFPGICFDITERMVADIALKAAKAEREFVLSLTSRQRNLTSPDAIIQLSLEELGHRLGADRCGFYRALPGGKVRAGPCWTNGSMEPLVGEFADDTFGRRVQDSWSRGQTLSYADSRADEIGGLDVFVSMGIHSGACVPMMREGRFHAGMFIHNREVRAWRPEHVALVREVAELTLLGVERAEALIRLENRVGQQEYALVQQAGELREQTSGRSAAESQVRQLQKMEAVGQLTGGIAHDFNNMLAVVIGGLNLLQRRLERGETDVARFIDGAMEGAKRAAELTQRLLAFSRQSPLAPEPIDLNTMMRGLTEMLDRTLGDHVELETVHGAGLWRAKADPNQLENVILNLAVNARDAMPEGGKLTIETSNAYMDDAYAVQEGVTAGQYVLIAVTDTGTGMTPDVMAKAFDPFFTTKSVGKGTGLGLSQVFGFLRQSGGHVKIYSEVGHGTTFKVYLPRFFGDDIAAPRRIAVKARGGDASEVILVVEDELRLRNFVVDALRELGYTVVHASDGADALRLIEGGQGANLLFTDIVMPGMTGRQLADAATPMIPGLKVLYTTGYTRNAVVHNGTLDPGTNFLPKPFDLDTLAAKVREVFDQTS